MFSCVWLHLKKNFGKYFLIFGCILENTIENTFFTCCSHFLTFSQLPNKHIMSFIPKNSNKTQDSIFSRWDSFLKTQIKLRTAYFLGEIAIGAISIGEIAIAISPISIASSRSQSRRFRCSRSRSREASIARSRSARSRSWLTSIGAVPVTGEIAIVVRRCGSFRLARCVGRSNEALREAVRVWERSACERDEEKVWSENKDWKWFQSFLAEFSVKLKIFSVWPNLPCQPNALFSGKWFPNFIFNQNKRSLSYNIFHFGSYVFPKPYALFSVINLISVT